MVWMAQVIQTCVQTREKHPKAFKNHEETTVADKKCDSHFDDDDDDDNDDDDDIDDAIKFSAARKFSKN